jgi:hypothetical protein
MPQPSRLVTKPAKTVIAPAMAGSVWDAASRVKMLLYGESGCLGGDTFINYEIRTPKGARSQNCKGGTLEHLYKRFHGLRRKGKGAYQRKQTIGSDYYVQSFTDEGRVVKNLVIDVLDSGVKQVFEVVTETGRKIKATANHPFWTGEGFTELRSLKSGDDVFVSPGKRLKIGDKKERVNRPEVMVKYHPKGRSRLIEGKYLYYRVSRAHLVLEASKNSMSPDEYRNALNTLSKEQIEEFWFVPRGCEVHHKDENPLNDVPDNLVLVESSSEHQKQFHAVASLDRPGMSIYLIPEKIESITRLGTERVYDIVVADPFRNFVANGFGVHNSGKTTFWATAPGSILCLICSGGRNPGELASINTPENRKRITPHVVTATDQLEAILKDAHNFDTVVLDHATGFQELLLKEIMGWDEIPSQNPVIGDNKRTWGEVASRGKNWFRAFFNLPTNVVIVAQERMPSATDETEGTEVVKPRVGAATTPALAGYLNYTANYIVQTYKRGKMKDVEGKDTKGNKVMRRVRDDGVEYCLRTGPDENYITKFRIPRDRHQHLPQTIINPTWEDVMKIIGRDG